jgi:hypothetical protein
MPTCGDVRETIHKLVCDARVLIDNRQSTDVDFRDCIEHAKQTLVPLLRESYLQPWHRLIAVSATVPRERLKACVRWLEQKAGTLGEHDLKAS